jgi:hypothetical protein
LARFSRSTAKRSCDRPPIAIDIAKPPYEKIDDPREDRATLPAGLDVCEYLELSIKEDWIGNYLIGYVKALLNEHYERRDRP